MDNTEEIERKDPSLSAPKEGLSGFFKLIKKSFALYRADFFQLMAIAALPYVLSLGVGRIFRLIAKSGLKPDLMRAGPVLVGLVIGAAVLFGLSIAFFFFWSQVALFWAVLRPRQGVKFKKVYLASFSLLGPFSLLVLLQSFIVVGSTSFLIVPGLLFAVWFSFSAFVLLDEGKKGFKALFRSKHLVAGSWWGVFGRDLTLFLLLVLLLLPISFLAERLKIPLLSSVASWLVAPLPVIFYSLLYKELKRLKRGESFVPPSAKKKGLVIGLAGLGLLIMFGFPVYFFLSFIRALSQ